MKNDRLLISDVTSLTRQLCDVFEGGQYEVLTSEVKLLDNGELKKYLVFFTCPIEEISVALDSIQKMEGMDVESFQMDSQYCVITFFENNMHSRSQISFGGEDDFPVKAKFSSRYQYIEAFFQRFVNYSNLFGNDIYRYYDEMIQSVHKFENERSFPYQKK